MTVLHLVSVSDSVFEKSSFTFRVKRGCDLIVLRKDVHSSATGAQRDCAEKWFALV